MYKYLRILTMSPPLHSPECLLTSSTSHLCFDSYLNLSIALVFRTDRTRSLGFILNSTSL